MATTFYTKDYRWAIYPADLEKADYIRYSADEPDHDVELQYYNVVTNNGIDHRWAGILDLSDELGTINAHISTAGSLAIRTGSGNDVLIADNVHFGEYDNTAYGGAGDDTINGSNLNNELYGEEGNDILSFTGYGTLSGGNGDDVLTGGNSLSTIYGGAGNDTIMLAWVDTAGSTVDGGTGTDVIHAVGNDISRYAIANVETLVTDGEMINGRVEQFLAFQSIIKATDDLTGEVRLQLAVGGKADFTTMQSTVGRGVVIQANGDGNDITVGDGGGFSIISSWGIDTMQGGAGNDALTVGANDFAYGGGGNDSIGIVGDDAQVWAGEGDDLIWAPANPVATIDGGSGEDAFATTNTLGPSITNLSFVNVEHLFASGAFVAASTQILESFDTISRTSVLTNNRWAVTLALSNTGAVNLASELDFRKVWIVAFDGGSAITTGSGADTLVGNVGNDMLNGGSGGDSMSGGLGDDIFIVNERRDTVLENNAAGTDTVRSSITYQLGLNLENLALTGRHSADASGNGAHNLLSGNSASNKLDGYGGADTLTGGKGDDMFVFTTVLKNSAADTIVDFKHADDWFQLDDAVFVNMSHGKLASNAFKEIAGARSTQGVDASDRILYVKATGDLYFDGDGSGTGYKRVLFAHVADNTVLDRTDFYVV